MPHTRKLLATIWLTAVLLCCAAFGQTMNSTAAAKANADWLESKFARKQVATIPKGTFYVNRTVETPHTVGCGRIETQGCCSYPVDNNPSLTGQLTRIVQLGSGPIFRIQGHGFYCDAPLELVGDGVSAAIEICSARQLASGVPAPNTGRHYIAHVTFQHWGAGLKCRGADDPNDDLHADNWILYDCDTYQCDRLVWLTNQQSVNGKVRDCEVNLLGEDDASVIVVDIERGGNVLIDGLCINHPYCTLFRLHDFGPVNTPKLLCRDFFRDRMPSFNGNYLTLIDYIGDPENAPYYDWHPTITGQVLTHEAPFDATKLFRVPVSLPRTWWDVNIDAGTYRLTEDDDDE